MKLTVLVACCMFALPIAVRADTLDPATQQALAANYQLACTAALNPNDQTLQAAFGILAPSFTSTDVTGGQVSRDDIVNNAGAQLKNLHTTVCNQQITAAQTSSDGSIVATEVLHLTGTVAMSDTSHSFALTTTSQDTWSNATGHWLIVHRRDMHVHFELDGSVVKDQGA
jgi:hypothetical protein